MYLCLNISNNILSNSGILSNHSYFFLPDLSGGYSLDSSKSVQYLHNKEKIEKQKIYKEELYGQQMSNAKIKEQEEQRANLHFDSTKVPYMRV